MEINSALLRFMFQVFFTLRYAPAVLYEASQVQSQHYTILIFARYLCTSFDGDNMFDICTSRSNPIDIPVTNFVGGIMLEMCKAAAIL